MSHLNVDSEVPELGVLGKPAIVEQHEVLKVVPNSDGPCS